MTGVVRAQYSLCIGPFGKGPTWPDGRAIMRIGKSHGFHKLLTGVGLCDRLVWLVMREVHVVISSRSGTWRAATAVALIAALMLPSLAAIAQHYDPQQEIPKPTRFQKMMTKLGRGISNIVLGWAEIPVTFDEKLKQGRSLGYLIGVAPVLGTARALMRTGVGVFEVITFPGDVQDRKFEAVIEPEYIF